MRSPFRVAVFSEVGHPRSGFAHFSGVSNFLSYNMRYCGERGVEMDLYSYAARDRMDEDGSLRHYGWRPRIAFRVDPTIPQDISHLVPDRRILSLAASRRYDVINIVAPGTMGMQGIWVTRRLRIPAVAMYTTSLAEYGGHRVSRWFSRMGKARRSSVGAAEMLCWRVMRRFYSRRNGIRAVLAPTRRIADEVAPRLDAPLAVLGRGVDTDLFRPGPANPRRHRAAEVVVLFSGRLHREEKGLHRFHDILTAIPEVRLLVVGDGPHRRELERDFGARAHFTGRLAGEELAAAYRQADLFVFPSKHDTFGQVVMEAMATGLPVVVTDRGGPRELVDHGVTGFIADDASFVPQVRRLVESSALRTTMGQNARAAAEARSWTRIFDDLMDLYARAAPTRPCSHEHRSARGL